MLKVIKRNNTVQYFDHKKIANAIIQAMRETIQGVDEQLSTGIAQKIENDLEKSFESVSADLQERVETELMNREKRCGKGLYSVSSATRQAS